MHTAKAGMDASVVAYKQEFARKLLMERSTSTCACVPARLASAWPEQTERPVAGQTVSASGHAGPPVRPGRGVSEILPADETRVLERG